MLRRVQPSLDLSQLVVLVHGLLMRQMAVQHYLGTVFGMGVQVELGSTRLWVGGEVLAQRYAFVEQSL